MDRFPVAVNRFAKEGVQVTADQRVLVAQFGDGYSQTASDGINTDISTYSLSWENLPKAEGDVIYEFLYPRLKKTPFLITLPDSSKEITVMCDELSKSMLNLDFYQTISCKLKRTAYLGSI